MEVGVEALLDPMANRRGGRPSKKLLVIPELKGPMNPLRLDIPENLSIESVDYYKRPDCAHYETCMEYAARCMWNQFHCRQCGAFKPIPREDLEKFAATLDAAFRRMNE
jgi:hypothetical protein